MDSIMASDVGLVAVPKMWDPPLFSWRVHIASLLLLVLFFVMHLLVNLLIGHKRINVKKT